MYFHYCSLYTVILNRHLQKFIALRTISKKIKTVIIRLVQIRYVLEMYLIRNTPSSNLARWKQITYLQFKSLRFILWVTLFPTSRIITVFQNMNSYCVSFCYMKFVCVMWTDNTLIVNTNLHNRQYIHRQFNRSMSCRADIQKFCGSSI